MESQSPATNRNAREETLPDWGETRLEPWPKPTRTSLYGYEPMRDKLLSDSYARLGSLSQNRGTTKMRCHCQQRIGGRKTNGLPCLAAGRLTAHTGLQGCAVRRFAAQIVLNRALHGPLPWRPNDGPVPQKIVLNDLDTPCLCARSWLIH
jgi:hypothetical protein